MDTKFKIDSSVVKKIKLKDLDDGNELCVGQCWLFEGSDDLQADIIFTQPLKVKFVNPTGRQFYYSIEGSGLNATSFWSTAQTTVDFGKNITFYSADGYYFNYWINYGPTVCKDEIYLDNEYPPENSLGTSDVNGSKWIKVHADLTIHIV